MRKHKSYYYEYNEFEEEIEFLTYDDDYGTLSHTKRRQEVSCYDYFCDDFDTMDDWA